MWKGFDWIVPKLQKKPSQQTLVTCWRPYKKGMNTQIVKLKSLDFIVILPAVKSLYSLSLYRIFYQWQDHLIPHNNTGIEKKAPNKYIHPHSPHMLFKKSTMNTKQLTPRIFKKSIRALKGGKVQTPERTCWTPLTDERQTGVEQLRGLHLSQIQIDCISPCTSIE